FFQSQVAIRAFLVTGVQTWALPLSTTKDAEIDSYDRVDTVYLLAKKRPQGPLLPSVRLLRTTGPHLLSELLLPASQGAPLRGPRSEERRVGEGWSAWESV